MDEQRLKDVPIFASLGKRERRVLAQHADEVDVPEGKELVRQDDFAYEFFVIESGTASVDRDEERVMELTPGDFFGEIGILRTDRRTATVVATSPMQLIVLTRTALLSLRRDDPAVARRLEEAVEQRLPADRS
jgi:CRP-like cAMP-binding protein